MKQKIWWPLVILSLVILISIPGCSSGKSISTKGNEESISDNVVAITYYGTFAGQTASGLLKLFIDVNIENRRSSPFDTSHESFSVSVNNYSYHTSESDLQRVDLPAGGMISGKLVFYVPPEANTTRVGYRVQHSEQALMNIRWIKQASPPVSNPVSDPVVSISHSHSFMWIKETRSLYMVLDLTIENKGYESFNTAPEYFKLNIGTIIGQTDPVPSISFDGALSDQKDGAYSDLRAYDLQNGGKLRGKLAFPVPTEVFASTEEYQLVYSGVRTYNIQWSRLPPPVIPR